MPHTDVTYTSFTYSKLLQSSVDFIHSTDYTQDESTKVQNETTGVHDAFSSTEISILGNSIIL